MISKFYRLKAPRCKKNRNTCYGYNAYFLLFNELRAFTDTSKLIKKAMKKLPRS